MTRRGFDRLHVCTREHYEPRRPDEVIVEHAGSYHVYRVDYDDWHAFTVWAAGKWTALDPRQGERLFHVCAEAQYPYLDIDAEPAVCRFYQNIDNQTQGQNIFGAHSQDSGSGFRDGCSEDNQLTPCRRAGRRTHVHEC